MANLLYVANNQKLLESRDWSRTIDRFDTVVRYGKCRQLGTTAGVKTDYVFLQWTRSCIEETKENADKIAILKEQRPLICLIREPKHPDELRLWMPAHSVFRHCPLMVLDSTPREKAAKELARFNSNRPYRPSTGMWVHEFLRRMTPNGVQVYTLGFAHTGSDHHCWDAERAYFDELYKDGSLMKLEATI